MRARAPAPPTVWLFGNTRISCTPDDVSAYVGVPRLVAQIARFSGNISRTAEFIGMERSALHRKLKSLGIGA